MLKIGSYNELVVQRAVDFGLYLNPKEEEVLLPKKYVPENTKPGDLIRVFVYTDSEDLPIATTLEPKAVVGDFSYLEVKDDIQIGSFMDWGLEKDLFVPRSEQQARMKVGKKYVLKVCLDERTDRVYGTTRIAENCDKEPANLVVGNKVQILIYDITKIGIMAVINNRYQGMLYKDQTFEPFSIGDSGTGYVIRIREDGKIDLSMKKPGYKSVFHSSDNVIQALKKSGGFIPCHDKSSPDEIKKVFSMSKKEFKKTIGGLYKKGIIQITNTGIRLKR
jgi:predicted RNA-binding protein (virulence factor B family)